MSSPSETVAGTVTPARLRSWPLRVTPGSTYSRDGRPAARIGVTGYLGRELLDEPAVVLTEVGS